MEKENCQARENPHNQLESGMTAQAWLVLVSFTSVLFLFYLGSARTITAHEGLATQVALQMNQSGNWLVPKIANELFIEKFPLHYWCLAFMDLLLGGLNETTARLPSVAFGMLGVFSLAWLIGKWFGSHIGLLTGLVQATTVYALTYSRLAECDIYLWGVIVAAIVLFASNVVTPMPPRWYCGRWAFFFLLGLVQLIKGPLFGAVLILIPCIGFVFLRRDWQGFKWLLFFPGILLSAAIAISWPFTVYCYYPDVVSTWWLHTFGRFNTETCIGAKPWWYYFSTLPWQMLPWTGYFFLGLPASFQRLKQGSTKELYLWIWFFGLFSALTLVPGKHHHYLMHAMPPCAFWAVGGFLFLRNSNLLSYRVVWGTVLGLLLISLPTILVILPRTPIAPYQWDILCLVVLALVSFGGMWWYYESRKIPQVLVIYFAMLLIGSSYFHMTIMRKTDNYFDDTRMLQRVHHQVDPDVPVFLFRYFPTRELFYLNRKAFICPHIRKLPKLLAHHPNPIILTSFHKDLPLRKQADVELVDQTSSPRFHGTRKGPHLVVYRLRK